MQTLTVAPFFVDCYFGIKLQLWSSRYNQGKQLYDAKWELPSRKIDRNNLAHSIEMFFPPSFGKIPIEVSKWRSQFRLRIGNGRTHYHLAVLLPRNPSCLSSISRLATARERFSFARKASLSQLGGDRTDHPRMKTMRGKRKIGKRARRKVCEHLTFLFLLWDLVLVKQFSDFPAFPLFTTRLTMRACVDQPRRGWARKT